MRCLKIHVSYNRKTIFSSDVKIQVLQQQILKWSTIYEISMPFPKKVQNESDFFFKTEFSKNTSRRRSTSDEKMTPPMTPSQWAIAM